ncbi:Endoribonuclease L-PSP/chorismate mutase-like protein [Dactylonectria macrodidyma]|uniref:Endoribonuclease L-PSP/chorismate mutase-like protein n=1 Tax=Dactylonectria macrodidyma TaxID=307937 RepID=A0A9P9JBN3_9HYPO|nr:Endoribonuclease L-PSP/chorismate mutase-like protein [Dactylonectria macrodidyma]
MSISFYLEQSFNQFSTSSHPVLHSFFHSTPLTSFTMATSVLSKDAPAPSPLMSQAVTYNGIVYCSGSLGIDPSTGKFAEGTVTDRTAQALKNLEAVLKAAGSSLENVLKVNIFLSSIDYYGGVNDAYAKFFTQEVKPCRTCVIVAELPLGAEVEIEATAYL